MNYNPNIVTISVLAGAGGEDAKDWARMLLRMYSRYVDKKNWKKILIDENELEIKGEGVYERLKEESGVHRLVRISPYDAKKLRHTSFALVDVLPELPKVDAVKIQIPEKDLKMEFSRSGGPGGQNVNKVETAVRIVHLPTGLSASAQVERSQSANRERALALLKAKLVKLMEEKHENEISNLRIRVSPEWGHEIRSYVLHPYKQVKDHRTGLKISRAEEVLEGKLDLLFEKKVE
ncbi:MAG: Peptide chain release factor 2 [Parcubacteria group bacterium GW2011_GWC1_45_9]|nr:MAG: Peptide chain release factor 2 [Parcubacteria group bacterium GW2011_GWB1_45_10]KKU16448.1 MAG: Peptide chain release factor 2 [Parcubacteria group bacterium GW2011_GWC1_45_9]